MIWKDGQKICPFFLSELEHRFAGHEGKSQMQVEGSKVRQRDERGAKHRDEGRMPSKCCVVSMTEVRMLIWRN